MILSIKKFRPNNLKDVNQMAEERNLPHLTSEEVPLNGYIAYNKQVVLGAVFLYLTDSQLCFSGNLITSKYTTREQRSEIIKALFLAAAEDAKNLGYKYFRVQTEKDLIISNLLDIGFVELASNATLLVGGL